MNLSGLVQRIGSSDNRATHSNTHEEKDKLGTIGEEKHDNIALVNTKGDESGSDFTRDKLDVRVGEFFTGGMFNEARFMRVKGSVLEDILGEGKVGRDVIKVRESRSEDIFRSRDMGEGRRSHERSLGHGR